MSPISAIVNTRKILIGLLVLAGIAPGWLNGLFLSDLSKNMVPYWLYEILVWICLPLLINLFGKKKNLFSNGDLGFHLKIRGQDEPQKLVVIIIIMAVLLPVFNMAMHQISLLLFSENYWKINFEYRQVIPNAINMAGTHFLVVLYFSTTAALVEEFLCRGMLRLLFNNHRSSIFSYIMLSSLIFSMIHWEQGIQGLFSTFCFGILTASVYAKIRNIWPVIFGHFFTDFFCFI